MSEEKYFHHWNLVFCIPKNGHMEWGRAVVMTEEGNLTAPIIQQAMQAAGVTNGGFLFSASNLGYMTKETFSPKPEIETLNLPAAFKEGFRVGMLGEDTLTPNPYQEGTKEAAQWLDGKVAASTSKPD